MKYNHRSRALGLTLLGLAALALPSPALQDAPPQENPWVEFDGVGLIINNDIVTLRELNTLLTEARSNTPVTTAEETQELLSRVTENTITLRLQTQAGIELGIPSEGVETTIDRYLADNRRGRSAQETEAWLREQGAEDLGAMRHDIRQELYRNFWMQGQRGVSVAGGRPFRDRYVRPGQLREAYAFDPSIFGTPTTFRLQFLVLTQDAWGDAETARGALVDLRQEIVEGADMGALVDEYGALLRKSRGITEPISFNSISDPAIRAFCKDSKEGSLSEVLPLLGRDGSLQGSQIVRIASRLEGQAAPHFGDANVQTRLEKMLQKRWDAARWTAGSDGLWRTAYIRSLPHLQILAPWVRRSKQ